MLRARRMRPNIRLGAASARPACPRFQLALSSLAVSENASELEFLLNLRYALSPVLSSRMITKFDEAIARLERLEAYVEFVMPDNVPSAYEEYID